MFSYLSIFSVFPFAVSMHFFYSQENRKENILKRIHKGGDADELEPSVCSSILRRLWMALLGNPGLTYEYSRASSSWAGG